MVLPDGLSGEHDEAAPDREGLIEGLRDEVLAKAEG
jgi:hypothetical protein